MRPVKGGGFERFRKPMLEDDFVETTDLHPTCDGKLVEMSPLKVHSALAWCNVFSIHGH